MSDDHDNHRLIGRGDVGWFGAYLSSPLAAVAHRSPACRHLASQLWPERRPLAKVVRADRHDGNGVVLVRNGLAIRQLRRCVGCWGDA